MPSFRKVAALFLFFACLLLIHGIITWRMNGRSYDLSLFREDFVYVAVLFLVVVFIGPRVGKLAEQWQGRKNEE